MAENQVVENVSTMEEVGEKSAFREPRDRRLPLAKETLEIDRCSRVGREFAILPTIELGLVDVGVPRPVDLLVRRFAGGPLVLLKELFAARHSIPRGGTLAASLPRPADRIGSDGPPAPGSTQSSSPHSAAPTKSLLQAHLA